MQLFGLREEEIPSLKPTIQTTIPWAKHPKSQETEASIRSYLSGLDIWPSEDYKNRFFQSGVDAVSDFYHPHAGKDHLAVPGGAWFALYFLVDDFCDADEGLAGQNVAKLLPLVMGTGKPEPGNGFEEGIFDVNERCRAACAGDPVSLKLCHIMNKTTIEWIGYNLDLQGKIGQNKDATFQENFNRIEEFLEHRVLSAGAPVAFPFVRWMCDVRLPQEIYKDPGIQRIERLSTTFGVLANDAFSLRKELKGLFKHGQGGIDFGCLNSVLWWAEKAGVSAREALKYVEEKLAELEAKFLEEVKEYLSGRSIEEQFGGDVGRAVREYMDIVVWFTGGNFAWHASCGRYNNMDLYT